MDRRWLRSRCEGKIFYHSGSNVIKFHNGSDWIALSAATGDITSVVAGAGLTGGATDGDATLNVVGGTGITANADDIQITDGGVGTTQLAIAVPCQTPVPIVPTVVKLDKVSIAASIVDSVVASKASILFKVVVPEESELLMVYFS